MTDFEVHETTAVIDNGAFGQRHVRFEERKAHFAQHLLGVRLGEPGFAAQRLDDARHPGSEIV